MEAIIAFLLGQAFLVHLGLIGGDVFAIIAVGLGIIWKSPEQSPSRHEIGKRLVIWGIAFETLCSACLFAFDEGISQKQQDKINAGQRQVIALEQRLAARTLDKSQAMQVAFPLAKYNGQAFQIVPYWDDSESLNLANQIADALRLVGWQLNNPTAFTMLAGVVAGIKVSVDKGSSARTHNAAKDLVAALKAVGIDANLGQEANNPSPTQQIGVVVGIKP
jgi:hypothetical protein